MLKASAWNIKCLPENSPLPLPPRFPVKFPQHCFPAACVSTTSPIPGEPSSELFFAARAPWQLHQHNSRYFPLLQSATFLLSEHSLTVLPAAQNTNCGMQHTQAVPRICSITEGFASNQLNNKCYLLLPCQSFLLKFPCAPSSLGCNKKVLAVKALIALLNTLLCSGKLMWMGKNKSPLGTRSRSRKLNSPSLFQSWSHSN